ncbi:hypothetical protein CLV28_1922 [Sediminihabitans luteus]|uniref:Uncharacterized protein n=1 Tax=Sediminihabitans luteus TaxID=1138585 RepID=A0A2M9CRG4_9CELL|nr:hypothetical protein [Sediminihabitans luteus]PJJ74425.1 hypothetical protein CLV28_1922 [Sediminihabitans luteus]GIJ00208.1 hypothetical protein Slu03_25850 [Sediminihabitans luteus]
MDDTATVPEAPRPDRRARVRARVVTYGLVGVLVVGALAKVEVWPLTSFHLFSAVRTGTSVGLELVAVADDGSRAPVVLDPAHPVLVTTAHEFGDLPGATPADQRRMVAAWLDAAHVDPADVSAVRLERVHRLADPDGVWHEDARELVTEVRP